MERTHLKAKAAALRMYPRLASKPKLIQSAPARRAAVSARVDAVTASENAAATRAQLRLRLLNMIIENENNRRHEPHAS